MRSPLFGGVCMFVMQTKHRLCKGTFEVQHFTPGAARCFVPQYSKQQPTCTQFPACNSLKPLAPFPAGNQTLSNAAHPLSQQASFLRKSHPYWRVPFQHQSFIPFPSLTTASPAVYGLWGKAKQNAVLLCAGVGSFVHSHQQKVSRSTDLQERE